MLLQADHHHTDDAADAAEAGRLAAAIWEAECAAAAAAPPRRPVATYRLQLHKGFTLAHVAAVVDYLDALGVSDCYLSPYLRARPGSTHGYDVFDHGKLNPEIGDDADDAAVADRLRAHGLGRVLDIVPNHMGITGENPHWQEVLEIGPQARSARFFDIDWHPVKEELIGRVLLPILGDQYGRVLEQGDLVLEREGGAFFVRYYERRLPLAPRSYATVLGRRRDDLLARFDAEDPHVQEYLSIHDAAANLPMRSDLHPGRVEGKRREIAVVKRRLARLLEESPALAAFVDEEVAAFAGTPGEPSSFDALHELLEQQAYRLAYWRVASEEINYRRFFDINDLAGLRVEDPEVFDAVHRKILDWVARGDVTALRIDHPDGLADPRGYFDRLQEATLLVAARRRFDEMQADESLWPAVADALRARRQALAASEPAHPLLRRFPIVAEKILSRGEDLPEDWPIDGTVGYEYLNALHGLFVDPAGASPLEEAYVAFTGDHDPFPEILYESKVLITRAALASEVNVLARQLNRVSESDRRSRDFTLNELRRAIREVIAAFPVYRTYIQPGQAISERDRHWIDQAIARARRRNPTTDASVFDFIRSALLREYPPGLTDEAIAQRDAFIRRFQQITGPVQAKGLEDTAFYRKYPLVALNEVGADPVRFGTTTASFHTLNAQKLKLWPGGLNATATHDTKRGEDTRVRIDALSELADEWKTRLARWAYWNARRKGTRDDAPVPDAREEYLLYQILVGAWPFGGPDDAAPEGLVPRVQEYMTKAVREAKRNTSWTDQDSSYVDGLCKFIADVLEGPDAAVFLKDFLPFQRRVARIGVVHSLGQALLKVASPGVPDVYQGCELWDLSLVDPDNRRPVDYDARRAMLARLRSRLAGGTPRADLARELLAAPEDGAVKLHVLATALGHRRANPELYASGTYRAVEAEGEHRGRVVAFGRSREGKHVVAVAARLVAPLMGPDGTTLPLGPEVWGDTRLAVPETKVPRRWRDLLTDTVHEVQVAESGASLAVGTLLSTLPVALLVPEPDDAG
jgi:(1->4)-alpha-D-glucan 1-alpha-D-glucosylmutase